MRPKHFIPLLALVLLFACDKEEQPIQGTEIIRIDMDSYSLANDTINVKDDINLQVIYVLTNGCQSYHHFEKEATDSTLIIKTFAEEQTGVMCTQEVRWDSVAVQHSFAVPGTKQITLDNVNLPDTAFSVVVQ